jgi:nitrogen fixation protein NifZ
MLPKFNYADEVRLIRNVRNDGTYPGCKAGTLLVRRGEIGCVYDVGTYLQDQLIYKVHFLGIGRTVGCREEELIAATEAWIPNRFEFREEVLTKCNLAINGEIVVSVGSIGSIEKVVRDHPAGVYYHVYFKNGKTLLVPETSLDEYVDQETPALSLEGWQDEDSEQQFG